jgi:hypothetical protein
MRPSAFVHTKRIHLRMRAGTSASGYLCRPSNQHTGVTDGDGKREGRSDEPSKPNVHRPLQGGGAGVNSQSTKQEPKRGRSPRHRARPGWRGDTSQHHMHMPYCHAWCHSQALQIHWHCPSGSRRTLPASSLPAPPPPGLRGPPRLLEQRGDGFTGSANAPHTHTRCTAVATFRAATSASGPANNIIYVLKNMVRGNPSRERGSYAGGQGLGYG